MIEKLLLWQGNPRYPHLIHVDVVYRPDFDGQVVYWSLFERDYLDTLQLILGKAIRLVAVWEWFDQVWDNLHDRRQNYTIEQCFSNVASTHGDLVRVVEKMDHWSMDRRKKQAFEQYARRNDPPATFRGVF